MSTLTNRPLRLWFVEFEELFARHLCRHSQTGVNVVHLIALFAIWYSVYGIFYQLLSLLPGSEWALAVPALAYLAIVALNVPFRVFAATASFLAIVVCAAVFLASPWWVYVVIIPVAYQVQSWSHRFYTVEFDMTEFNRKYTKGSVLFVVLLIYEVPIVLNFLLFGQRRSEPREDPVDQERTAVNAS